MSLPLLAHGAMTRTPTLQPLAMQRNAGERDMLGLDIRDLQVIPPRDLLATWIDVEDLWLRLDRHFDIHIIAGDAVAFAVKGVRSWPTDAPLELRRLAMDPELCNCRIDGQVRPIVSLIEFSGRNLVLTLSRRNVLERWPEGRLVDMQIQAFVMRLQWGSQGACREA